MNQVELQQKLKELVGSVEFADKLAMCSSLEDTASLFKSAGIEVNAADLAQAMEMVAIQKGEEELDETYLENASGGIGSQIGAEALVAKEFFSLMPKRIPTPKPVTPKLYKK